MIELDIHVRICNEVENMRALLLMQALVERTVERGLAAVEPF